MTMTRRSALGSLAAALLCPATFVLPARRKTIDLMQFCDFQEHRKYDMRLPYELDDWTYATDSKICVRVRPATGDVAQRKDKMPPFSQLSWNHDKLRIPWRTMPRLDAIEARDSDCTTCRGYGHVPYTQPAKDCEKCDGLGREWLGNGWDLSVPVTCRACNGKGYHRPADAVECPQCHGKAIGVFPSIVELDGRYFDAGLYAKAQALGGEFVHDNWNGMASYPLLKFRFDGGHGMLIGLDPESARKRIV